MTKQNYLIKEPLTFRLKETFVQEAGSRFATEKVKQAFWAAAASDCNKCPSAKMSSNRSLSDDTTLFSYGCTKTACFKAGWSRNGPIINGPIVGAEKKKEDDRIDAIKAVFANPSYTNAASTATTTYASTNPTGPDKFWVDEYADIAKSFEKQKKEFMQNFDSFSETYEPTEEIVHIHLPEKSKDVPSSEGSGSW